MAVGQCVKRTPEPEWGPQGGIRGYTVSVSLSLGCGRGFPEQDGVGRQAGGSERVHLLLEASV